MNGILPNLLIVGVPKAGTGSLFAYLGQHPEICPSSVKETGYFNPVRYEGGQLRTLDWYKQHWAHYAGETYALEATPSYCYGGVRLINAIEEILNEPRILMTLRNPVDRLWSTYAFQRSTGNLPSGIRSFGEYVTECERRRRHGIRQGPHFAGLRTGFYGDYVPNWFNAMGDRVKVVFTDDLFRDPQATVQNLCHWLEIEPEVTKTFDYGARNKTAHARSIVASRLARSVKRRSDGLLRVTWVEHIARRLYLRLNTGEFGEKPDRVIKERLASLYAPSNSVVAATLRDHGYTRFPPWLDRERKTQGIGEESSLPPIEGAVGGTRIEPSDTDRS